ncbi:MAG: IPT/TIG domain-containing protein [Dehalococcoidales bacterium]|nr:IPT/TIG domain-containing protein [Dehalococcoidales bacterium]
MSNKRIIKIKPVFSVGLIICLLVSLLAFPVNGVAASSCTVSISPAAQSVANGATFTVDITIDTTTPFLGWQADLSYDATKIDYVSVTEGTFLKNFATTHGGFTYFTPGAQTSGMITAFGCAAINVTTGGLTGSGTLCTITFHAKDAIDAVTPINLANVKVSGEGAIPVSGVTVTSGSVNIGSPPPAPTITDFNPSSGKQGDSIIITGTNFTEAYAVSFGGTAAQSFIVNSDTQITVIVASGSSGVVSVTTPGGTATKDGFTFVTGPTITAFNPISGKQGDSIIITGTGFIGATAVSFGGTAAQSFTVDSDTQITAIVAGGSSGSVSVTTQGGTATKDGFGFLAAPAIESFAPTSGGNGTTIIITGSGFTGATAVSFGGTAAQSFSADSDTQITAIVAGGSSGSVGVVSPRGTASKNGFTFIPAPTITAYNPASGKQGDSVIITGTNFTGATTVSFGGTAAQNFTVDSDTQITAVVAGGSSGTVNVTTLGGTATNNGFTFLPVPVVSSFSPVTAGSGATVVITGSHFTGATAVSFGGTAAQSLTVNSDTQITAIVGSGSSGQVTVTGAYGTGSKAGFTFAPPSTIASFTPTAAYSGEKVTITGTNLEYVTSVKFGGVNASSFTIDSSTQLTATVGYGASGSVYVSSPGGTATLPGFTYNGLVAGVSIFTPISAHEGDNITIIGNNLDGATEVKFGTDASGVGGVVGTIISNTTSQIIARVGSGASGHVSVKTPLSPNPVVSSGLFTFLPTPNTRVTAVPSSNTINGGDNVTVELKIDTQIPFLGWQGEINFDPARLQCTGIIEGGFLRNYITSMHGSITSMPYYIDNVNGKVTGLSYAGIGVATGLTGEGILCTLSFESFPVTPDTSVTTYVTPINITVAGEGGVKVDTIVTAGNITIQNIRSPDWDVNEDGVCDILDVVSIGNHWGETGSPHWIRDDVNRDGMVDVLDVVAIGTHWNQQVSSTPPTILRFSPSSGKTGDTITIIGTNFIGTSAVSFGGTSATSFHVDTDYQITAVVGAGTSGNVIVTTASGSATKAGFTYVPSLPSITLFSPPSCGTGDTISIAGYNLGNALAVKLGTDASGNGGATATVITNTDTLITATVGSGASGYVAVITADGIATKSGFTFLTTPTITSFNPTSGQQGDSIIITGTGLSGATAVSFGDTAAQSFTVNSATQITAIVGSGSNGVVSVTTPGGNATKDGFSFTGAVTTPSISSFTPTSGGNGTSVTIIGSGFTGATAVSFGGTAAQSFTVNSTTQITATVGSGSSGTVSVTTLGGTATKTGFIYVPGPSITSFSPTTGINGTTVVIAGNNFTEATTVSFGGTAAASFEVNAIDQITAVVGEGSSGTVSVTTPGGTATATGFTYLAPRSDITLTATPSGTSADPGDTFTVNLDLNTSVAFLGWQSDILFDPTKLTCTAAEQGTWFSDFVTGRGGNYFPVQAMIDNATGKVSLGGSSLGISTGQTGQGTLCTLTFEVKTGATGDTIIKPTNVKISDEQAAQIINATVVTATVSTGAVPVPTIMSFSPTSGQLGDSIVISGTGLIGATAVSFGGTPAQSFTVNSATQITAVLGGGSSGTVSVTTSGGTGTKTGFTYIANPNAPAPTITSFTPTSGGSGDSIVITGTNLTGTTMVSFGGTAAATFSVNSNTQITAVLGNGSSGAITVETSGGISAKDGFTYSSPATAPAITSVINKLGSKSGGNGTKITIFGLHFTGVTGVSIGGIAAASYTFNCDSQITAVVGNGTTGDVRVTTNNGIGVLPGFAFIPAPSITSFTPTNGSSGTTLVITGTNLIGATGVTVGSTVVASFNIDSATQITAILGNGSSGPVSVETPGGIASKEGFTYSVTATAPVITAISPSSGQYNDTITISGSNLAGATTVKIGSKLSGESGTAATITNNTDTQIVAVLNGTGTGSCVAVTTAAGTATKTGFSFIPLSITTFSPAYGDAVDQITITGTDLDNVNSVTFGSAAGTIVSKTDTQIIATVGNGHSGAITISTADSRSYSLGSLQGGFAFVPSGANISFTANPSSGTVIAGETITVDLKVDFVGSTKRFLGWRGNVDFDATKLQYTGITEGSFLKDYITSHGGTWQAYNPVVDNTNGHITGISYAGLGVPTGLNGAGTLCTLTFTVKSGVTGGTSITPVDVFLSDDHGTPGPYKISPATLTAGSITIEAGAVPEITSFTPTSGTTGTTVTITGSNFTDITAVKFGGTAAQSFTVDSDIQITAIIGLGSSGDISVTNPSGTGTKSGFTFTAAAPAITSFTPTSATYNNTVVINGTNFTGASVVTFGTTEAKSFTVDSSTKITAVVGRGSSGSVSVTTPDGGTGTKDGFTFTTTATAPSITSFSPTTANIGNTVTITGTNFTGATSVSFGTTLATSFTVNSSSQITAVVGKGSTGTVSVGGPMGTATKGGFIFSGTASGPVVTSFTPSSGGTGTTITINGKNFTGATTVKFGGISSSSKDVVSDTQITAVVGSGATGDILVTTPNGTAVKSGFTYYPEPVISSVSPTTAAKGTTVIISGEYFENVSSVKFGGTAAASFVVNSTTNITAIVDTGSSGSVSVTTPGGTGTFAGFTFLSPRSDVTVTVTPSATSVAPDTEFTVELILSTTPFILGWQTDISFDATKLEYISLTADTWLKEYIDSEDGTWLTPSTPVIDNTNGKVTGISYAGAGVSIGLSGTGTLATLKFKTKTGVTGSTNIELSNFKVSTDTSESIINATVNNGNITISSTAPNITSFSPTSGKTGDTIVITGTNFTGATAVSFGGTAAASFTVDSATQITAILSTGSSGTVSVTTPNGTATKDGFTFNAAAPTITSFSPTSGKTGDTIVITGTNFTGATNVKLGGTAATSFTVNSGTQITAIVGNGTSGNVSVTTPGGTATLAGFTFNSTSNTGAPTITSFSPTSGKTGDTIVITGTNFTGATNVKFGGTAATSFTVNSGTQITAIVGNGTSGNVSVTTPGGTATLAGFIFSDSSNPSMTQTTTTGNSTGVNTNDQGNNNDNNNNNTAQTPVVFDISSKVSTTGVATENIILTEVQDGEGAIAVRIEIKKGTQMLDKYGDPLKTISISRASLSKSSSGDIIPVSTYDLAPDGSQFSTPISITVVYDPDTLPKGAVEKNLKVIYYSTENSSWEKISSQVDTEKKLIMWTTDHFSIFTIVSDASFALSRFIPFPFVPILAGILAIGAVIALAILKRQKIAFTYNAWRKRSQHTTASDILMEESESTVVNGYKAEVVNDEAVNIAGYISAGGYEEQLVRTIEIDRGNVKCNEIGIVLGRDPVKATYDAPTRIKLGYDPGAGSDNLIKISIIKKNSGGE